MMEELFWVKARGNKHISVIVHTPNAEINSISVQDTVKERRPAIVYMHGFTGTKTGDNRMGVNLARALCQEGYVVIRFDYIGSGESEGEFDSDTHFSGWIEDAHQVLAWARTLPQVEPQRLGIIGHSLGGALVTYIAAQVPSIKAVCALAPVTYLEDNFKQVIIGPERWAQALKGETIRHFYNKKYALKPLFIQDLLQYDTLQAARKVSQPFLIIHGRKDEAVPAAHSHDLLNHLEAKDKHLQILADEEHLFSPSVHSFILNWFNRQL